MLFNPSRREARQFFYDSWRKYEAHEPLTPLEQIAVAIIGAHPEYHTLLRDEARWLDHDWRPEHGQTNPFLHLSLHLAVEEQLSIDQPPGIRARFDRACAQLGEAHAAQHALLEALGEMIWQAQRQASAPDPAVYFTVLDQRFPHV